MEKRLSKGGNVKYLTTDTAEFFKKGAFRFGMEDISAESLTF
jgi:glutamate racemase